MAEPKITKRKVTDYKPDHHNANKGTERGQYMIDQSVSSVGLARSIVAAADDTVPAGNKTLQAAIDAGIEDVIEIETDGSQLVVVKRTDWQSVDSEQARTYAYLDNRAAEVGLEWDVEQIITDVNNGVDLSGMFFDWELDTLLGKAQEELDPRKLWDGMPAMDNEDFGAYQTIKVHFTSEEALKAFAQLVGQSITDKTKYIYYPPVERENLKQYRVVDES